MTPHLPKVFGIGLSKTGTSSLDRALNDLGIRSIHFPSDETTFQELSAGNYALTILNTFQAATDISISPFFAQFDEIYPDSKFILTVRDLDSWLDSVRNHWDFMWQWAAHDRQFRRFLEFITACVYGVHTFNQDRFVYAYRQHIKNVCDYFAARPRNLLTIDICAGDGWEPLCSFLNLPVPSHSFPCANRREEKLERTRWMQMLTQAVAEFERFVPSTERYVLIDDERLAGSSLDVPGRATRPMEKDRVYFGPPPNSTCAIAEIEQLRLKDIRYLVLTWPSFWWLEFYSELEPYFNARYRSLFRNDRLLILESEK